MDIRQLAKENDLYPDILVFSGDAAFGTTPQQSIEDQYLEVGRFLDAVRKAFDPEIPIDRVFMVPGNHDVDRSKITPSETEYLINPSRREEEIIDELNKNSLQSQRWMERLEAYRKFLKDYGLTHLDPDNPHLIWTNTITIHGHKIKISGFNSAWSCARKEEKGKLWLGGRWQLSKLAALPDEVDLSIAVIHHPSNWLNDQEDPAFGHELRDKFNVCLHGHEHIENVSQIEDGNLLVSAGACYNCSWMPNGYNFAQIELDGSGGRVFLRHWEQIGAGWVAKNIAKKAPHGTWKLKQFTGLANNSKEPGSAGASYRTSPILNLTSAASEDAIAKRLQSLQKRPLNFESQHSRIRLEERAGFERHLADGRFCWLIADWQMGKEGFISATLNNLGSSSALDNVYRIDCGLTDTIDKIFDGSDTQLGIAFVEFAEIIRRSAQPTLIFEDIPINLLKDITAYSIIRQRIKSILDFSPNLRVICILRQWPSTIPESNVIRLSHLDTHDVAVYLKSHPKAGAISHRQDLIERIHSYTAGLPSAIDRLIDRTNLLSIDDILKEQHDTSVNTAEPIPQSLIEAVTKVFNPENEKESRSLILLKLLTVLKDGETFDSIKKFYHKKPFFIEHVFLLADLALIESVEIAQTGSNLIPRRTFYKPSPTDAPKLLRVPRQVRDYVLSKIPQEEKNQIFSAASESLFGGKWYEGKINLRRSIITAYRQSSIAGPGNELLVAQYLLQTALASGRADRIERFARLAVGYCSELVAQGRFRDSVIAAGIVAEMIEGRGDPRNWIRSAYNYAYSLRMTGQHTEALSQYEAVLKQSVNESNEFKSDLFLHMAWCHESYPDKASCILYANKAIDLTEKESGIWFQGHALIAEQTKSGSELESLLAQLAERAKNLKHTMASNNIYLNLSKISKSKKTSLMYLDIVLSSAKDMYNRSRAISRKAELLRVSGRIMELTPDEQGALCQAYEYSYGQRIHHLLDSCHESLWELCRKANIWVSLFRLYRYTSFVWALTGRTKSDKQYKDQLLEIRDSSSEYKREFVEVEVLYLENRIISEDEIDCVSLN